jgi:hypothetical protein
VVGREVLIGKLVDMGEYHCRALLWIRKGRTLIFLVLQLKQPPRDFLWDLLVKLGAKVRCARAFGCVSSRSPEQSGSGNGDTVDEALEVGKRCIT